MSLFGSEVPFSGGINGCWKSANELTHRDAVKVLPAVEHADAKQPILVACEQGFLGVL